MPTTCVVVLLLVETRSLTRKKLSWFPGADSVNIWLRSLQGPVLSTLSPDPYFVFAHAGTSKNVTIPRQSPAPA